MIRLIVFILLNVMSIASYAHQQKEAYSTLLFNPRTGNLEVAHRFYIHDAEHVVKTLTGSSADIISSTDTQSALADYVLGKFAIKLTEENDEISLSTVGFEVEGKFFWVYQEAQSQTVPKQLYVKMRAFFETWPSQVNQVNVEYSGKVKSARIKESDQFVRIALP